MGGGWTTGDYLLASAVDALNVLIWQKTKAGSEGKGFPKPILRPGEEPKPDDIHADGATFGTKGLSRDDVDALLAKFAPGGDDVRPSSAESSPAPSKDAKRRRAPKTI